MNCGGSGVKKGTVWKMKFSSKPLSWSVKGNDSRKLAKKYPSGETGIGFATRGMSE
ncbi:hypothetical protein SRABI106_01150 [Rahnella aquatilis]|nr:hypothetical protein SRABI106_01150 [Rahnella aquatilis]